MEENKINRYQTKTVVKGLRAEQSFFDKIDSVALEQNTNRNELIVRVMKDYLWQIDNQMGCCDGE